MAIPPSKFDPNRPQNKLDIARTNRIAESQLTTLTPVRNGPPSLISVLRANRNAAILPGINGTAASNGAANTVSLVPTPTPTPTPDVIFDTLADLINTSQSFQVNNKLAYVNGYYSSSDNGQGYFTYNSTSTAQNDAGAIVQPSNITGAGRWIRQFGSYGTPEMWGAKPNLSTFDSSSAFQFATRYLELNSPNYLKLDAKTYYLSGWYNPTPFNKDPSPITPNSSWRIGCPIASNIIPLGYYAQGSGKRCNLTIQGTGSASVLYVDTRGQNILYLYQNFDSIINILEQVDSINLFDFTIDRSGYYSLGNAGPGNAPDLSNGIAATSNEGAGTVSYLGDLATNNISITGITFINCHRSININRSILPYGIRKLVFSNNRMLYPRGSDSNAGAGSPMCNAGYDVEFLLSENNYAEGSSSRAVSDRNGPPKDGWWFNTGKQSIIRNNTVVRFGVEAIYGPQFRSAGFFTSSLSTFTIPPVGGQTRIVFGLGDSNSTTGNFYNYWKQYLTAYDFVTGSYISFLGGTYVDSSGNTQTIGDGGVSWSGGYYRIDSIDTSNSTPVSNSFLWSSLITRVSGISGDTNGFGNYLNNAHVGGSITGLSSVRGSPCPYGFGTTYSVRCSVIGNTIGDGVIYPWSNNVLIGASPSFRSDLGYAYLANNICYGVWSPLTLWAAPDTCDPMATSEMVGNTAYMYNYIPNTSAVGGNASPFRIDRDGATIHNNTVIFWSNSMSGTDYASDVYQPVNGYNTARLYAVASMNIGQRFIDNTFICTIPLSGFIVNYLTEQVTVSSKLTLSGNQVTNCADVSA